MGNTFRSNTAENTAIQPASKPFFGNTTHARQSFFTPAPAHFVQRDINPKEEQTDLAEPKEKSALRDELSKLFEEFEGVTVGDKKFDSIIEKDDWEDAKAPPKKKRKRSMPP